MRANTPDRNLSGPSTDMSDGLAVRRDDVADGLDQGPHPRLLQDAEDSLIQIQVDNSDV